MIMICYSSLYFLYSSGENGRKYLPGDRDEAFPVEWCRWEQCSQVHISPEMIDEPCLLRFQRGFQGSGQCWSSRGSCWWVRYVLSAGAVDAYGSALACFGNHLNAPAANSVSIISIQRAGAIRYQPPWRRLPRAPCNSSKDYEWLHIFLHGRSAWNHPKSQWYQCRGVNKLPVLILHVADHEGFK